MEDQWYPQLDTLHINPLYTNGPFRSYHSSDEADAGSPGGGGFHPGHGSGRDFMGHGQSTPSFSAHGRLLVEDAPYLPPREAPVQFVSPASLHADNAHPQYFEDRPFHYRPHVEEQWTASPPPYYAEPSHYNYTPQPMPTAMPPSAFMQSSRYPDAGEYLRGQLNLPSTATVNLWCLPDPPGGGKPSIPLPMLIKLAIYGSPKKRLTLQEIYGELAQRFTWFRENQHDQAWKNSIRHNLSLNKVFKNMQRPVTEPGKGSYWELDISGGEGYKRPRKRLNQSQKRNSGGGDEDDLSDDGSYSDNDHTGDAEYPNTSRPRRRSPYSQGGAPQARIRANTGRSRESSTPPIAGPSRGGSMSMIDPPASQRRQPTYSQPGYGQAAYQVDPALNAGPSAGPSSYYAPPSGRALAHSRSATPLDTKPPGMSLRPRVSAAALPSSSSGAPVSPTDEAYSKSRRRSQGRF